ncbi:MAG: hypothetical protein ABI480_12145 [Chitinophagaceae bacterium]
MGWLVLKSAPKADIKPPVSIITKVDSILNPTARTFTVIKIDSNTTINSDTITISKSDSTIEKNDTVSKPIVKIIKSHTKSITTSIQMHDNSIFIATCLLFIILGFFYQYSFIIGKTAQVLTSYLITLQLSFWEHNFSVFTQAIERPYLGYSRIQTRIFICLGVITLLYPRVIGLITSFFPLVTKQHYLWIWALIHIIVGSLYIIIVGIITYSRGRSVYEIQRTWRKLKILSELGKEIKARKGTGMKKLKFKPLRWWIIFCRWCKGHIIRLEILIVLVNIFIRWLKAFIQRFKYL